MSSFDPGVGERSARHELAMLERLRGAVGVATEPSDARATTLAEIAKPLPADELIGLALDLARAVAAMHARGVMHRDIAPSNIVLSRDGRPRLGGFGLATSVAEIRPEFTHPAEIAGTLAYMAPEQTGRTARAVDRRADLYALGATLYELATGVPPFGSGDPLRLTHDQLARVPTPPAEVEPALPEPLSEIVMHLLEKEPDQRYQSAEGLVHDLERLHEDPAAKLRVGAYDVPLRLLPPSRLAGRGEELATLRAAFADSASARCHGLLVGGAAGVGKTALVDELRPVVTDADGWFVAGKFDQHRRDLAFDAVNQALRALGRLLLAEPEDRLAEVRSRIVAAVGANAGLLAATVPELATLLGVPPDAGDPLTAQARVQRSAQQVLHAVASRERPLVVFLDDLQWAGRTPLGVVDLVLGEEPVDGLLLVAAYREGDVETAPALAGSLARWREQPGVRTLQLGDLATSDLVTMVADMLHADPSAAVELAELIEPRTRGNPYETVELLEALRRDGVLTASAQGWRWDLAAARAQPGADAGEQDEAAGAIPADSRALVEAMACLGGRAEPGLLEAATGVAAALVDEQLAPPLAQGLLVLEPGPRPAVRFRHDRIREAVLHRLDGQRQAALHLAMARRLAGVPDFYAVAADQYLAVADAIDDPRERLTAVELLRRAATDMALIGDHPRVDALLSTALELADPADTARVAELRSGRHAALFSLGRLEEADGEYRAIERLLPRALDRADVTALQVRSLTHRNRFAEAIELGLETLRACGLAVPEVGSFATDPDRQFERLYRWLDDTDPGDDLARAELSDPVLLTASRLIDAVLPAGYFVPDPPMIAWLGLEALRIWTEHGPSSALVGPAGHAAYHVGPQRGDFPAAYRALRRIVGLGEARGYEPGTSQARHMLTAVSYWFEPIENGVRSAQQAREGFIAGADLTYAGYTYQLGVPYLADCASLDRLAAEVESGLAFLRRTGDEQTGQWLDGYQWLIRVLREEGSSGTSEALAVERYAETPLPLLFAHLSHGVAAAVFGDAGALQQHSAAAMPLLPGAAGAYANAVVRLLRGLALAGEVRAADAGERGDLLAELDGVTDWIAARAVDAPENFLHVLRLIEAERAWAIGDFRTALLAFDAARRAVDRVQRPWHRALIAERAARFHLANGLEHTGSELLAAARADYLAWGATAKVDRLDWAYPELHAPAAAPPSGARATVSPGTVDLLGILSASQALSSETGIERLHQRVVEVLGAMTGATGVQLVLWSEEQQEWLLPSDDGRQAPMSVLHYTRRSGETLVVSDARQDDRFARDPWFADAGRCSLLAVPILSRGTLRAVLVLENRLIRGAFSFERLDAVKLIAGQLAVSLDNAQLYAELATSRGRIVAASDQARRRIERDLHDGAQQRLLHTVVALKLARQALGDTDADSAELVADALESAERGIEEIRELARGIHPRILTSGGLVAALEAVARRSPIPVTLELSADARLPENAEVTAYYVVSEALTNATRHSQASGVRISVDTTDDAVELAISDDGVGGAAPDTGSGLVGLRDRVEAVGGVLTVHSPAGQGTRVAASIPLPS